VDNTEPWKDVDFIAKSVTKSKSSLPEYLKSSQAIGIVVSPDEVYRPDGILMLSGDRALTVGSKVRRRNVEASEVISQLRSADMGRACLGGAVNGSIDPDIIPKNSLGKRIEWVANNLHLIIAVRILITLIMAVGGAYDDATKYKDRLGKHRLLSQEEIQKKFEDGKIEKKAVSKGDEAQAARKGKKSASKAQAASASASASTAVQSVEEDVKDNVYVEFNKIPGVEQDVIVKLDIKNIGLLIGEFNEDTQDLYNLIAETIKLDMKAWKAPKKGGIGWEKIGKGFFSR